MTYPQAIQLILEKALSLDSGWAHASTDYIGSVTEEVYTHPKLPGVMLVHAYNTTALSTVTLTTNDDKRHLVASSDALTKHLEVVKRSIADAESLALENRIIEIASKLP